jgi:hypothetical protein
VKKKKKETQGRCWIPFYLLGVWEEKKAFFVFVRIVHFSLGGLFFVFSEDGCFHHPALLFGTVIPCFSAMVEM